MSIRSGLALLKVPSFAPATLAILMTILAEAVAGSYMALLAVEKVGMSPLELSAFLTLSAISGIAVTTLFGHMHDRRPTLWPLLLSLSAKVLGYGLCAVLTDTWMLLAVAFVLFGLSNASFPLLFAIAKGYLDQAGGDAPTRGMASLRMTASLGWAIGPAVGAVLVAVWGFGGVYGGAAALALVTIVTVLVGRIGPTTGALEAKARVTLDVALLAAPLVVALVAFHTAMFMGSNAMSITVVRSMGTETDVGLLFSLCALLEVFVMGAFVMRPHWSRSRSTLVAGFLMFVAYFVLVLLVPTLAALYFGQLFRAAGIGIISIVGMARLQDLLPGRAGVASALFGNTMSAGFLVSGLGTGIWAEAFGYWSLFGVCAGLCAIGAVAVALPVRR